MSERTRAKAGGEVGKNGEFYHGGEFLPSTMMNKGTWRRVQAEAKERSRKVLIDYFVWEVRPSLEVVSIFDSIQGKRGDVRPGKCGAIPQACGNNPEFIRVVSYWIKRWQEGERWMPVNWQKGEGMV